MSKTVLIVILVIGCCYCLDRNDLFIEETRAKKKKTSNRLLGMILLFIFSKVAIFKAASAFFMMAFFQKMFQLFGLFLSYFLKSKAPKPTPSPMYGAPSEYNTVSYAYGPPEKEMHSKDRTGYPGLSDFGDALDWVVHKNVN